MAKLEGHERQADADTGPGGCCYSDPYASLPPEMRPKTAAKKDGLRQVSCPSCGLIYWTIRTTDVYVGCDKVGRP